MRLSLSVTGAVAAMAVWAASGVSARVGTPLDVQGGGVAHYTYRIVNTYPHDSQSYTQGLIFRDGFFYESAGRYGVSSLRKVKPETGVVLQRVPVEARHFAEGLTEWKGKLIQLTWETNTALVYDMATLKFERTFTYSWPGWGLTHDGTSLILSDGTDTLHFLNPDTFRETRSLRVKDGNTPVRNLNELEFVRGEIYANVYQTERIARISPTSGAVLGWIDMTGLLRPGEVQNQETDAVLNGIAYDATADRLFVTGKLWPRLFEIKLERKAR